MKKAIRDRGKNIMPYGKSGKSGDRQKIAKIANQSTIVD
jgi:hypothetical protein